MSIIEKGIISSIEESPVDRNDDPTKARVLPCTAQNMPTRPLTIAWYLRGPMGDLKVGDKVWFALADDLSGIIFEREDGEWTGIIPGDVQITGDVDIIGEETVGVDVKSHGVSLIEHTHLYTKPLHPASNDDTDRPTRVGPET